MTNREEEAQLAEARRRLAHAMEDPRRLGRIDRPGFLARAVARRPLPFAGAAIGALAGVALLAEQRRSAARARRRRRPLVAGSAAAVGLAVGVWLRARQAGSRAA